MNNISKYLFRILCLVLVFPSLSLVYADVSLTSDGKVPGGPFTYLQEQIDNIELTPGEQGIPGPQGSIGLTGDTGLKGDKGDTGDQGIQGPIGLTGDTGLKGDKGDTGPQGIQGEVGPQGPQGVAGNDGADGADGATGAEGPPGPAGPGDPPPLNPDIQVFLRIGNVIGDVIGDDLNGYEFDGYFNVLSWNWGVSLPRSPHLGSGGFGIPKVTDMTVELAQSAGSASLIGLLFSGKSAPDAELVVRNGNGVMFIFEMTGVFISSVNLDNADGSSSMIRRVSLNFSQMRINSATVELVWNIATNIGTGPNNFSDLNVNLGGLSMSGPFPDLVFDGMFDVSAWGWGASRVSIVTTQDSIASVSDVSVYGQFSIEAVALIGQLLRGRGEQRVQINVFGGSNTLVPATVIELESFITTSVLMDWSVKTGVFGVTTSFNAQRYTITEQSFDTHGTPNSAPFVAIFTPGA